MAKKKQILVSDILRLIPEDAKAAVVVYAYGIRAGDTFSDGMETAKDCLENMNIDCLKAEVGRVRYDEHFGGLVISAEVIH